MKKTLLFVLAMALVLPTVLIAGCKSPAATSVATTFFFTTQPVGGNLATAGEPFKQQPVVSAFDAFGNVVTGYSSAVTLSITPGTGASRAILSGTLTVNAVHGVATFKNISINTAGNGYSLTATGGGSFSAVSNPFGVAVATTTITPTATS